MLRRPRVAHKGRPPLREGHHLSTRRHLHVGTDDALRLESRAGRELSMFGLITEGPSGAQHAVPDGELAALCGYRPRRVWSELVWSARERPWSLCADCAEHAQTGTAP